MAEQKGSGLRKWPSVYYTNIESYLKNLQKTDSLIRRLGEIISCGGENIDDTVLLGDNNSGNGEEIQDSMLVPGLWISILMSLFDAMLLIQGLSILGSTFFVLDVCFFDDDVEYDNFRRRVAEGTNFSVLEADS